MRSSMKALLAVAGGAVVIGFAVYVLMRPVDLPEPQREDRREVFPDLDLRAAAPGSAIDRIYGAFGKKSSESKPRWAAAKRCIYFTYDPDLFEGALVVLANAAVVEKSWVVKGSTKPEECSALPEETVDLRGWYAAAVR
jgi:hypothetical protein